MPKPHEGGAASMFLYALIASQFISNVPSTVLLQKSSLFLPLAWGANIGGNGTLIASLANFIAYRQGGRVGALRFMGISAAYMEIVAVLALPFLVFL